jgi:hypothetical protein
MAFLEAQPVASCRPLTLKALTTSPTIRVAVAIPPMAAGSFVPYLYIYVQARRGLLRR